MCAFDLIKVLGKESGKEGKRRREGRGERERRRLLSPLFLSRWPFPGGSFLLSPTLSHSIL